AILDFWMLYAVALSCAWQNCQKISWQIDTNFLLRRDRHSIEALPRAVIWQGCCLTCVGARTAPNVTRSAQSVLRQCAHHCIHDSSNEGDDEWPPKHPPSKGKHPRPISPREKRRTTNSICLSLKAFRMKAWLPVPRRRSWRANAGLMRIPCS